MVAAPKSARVVEVRAGLRAPRGFVIVEPEDAGIVDWSRWYLTDEDDMGEGAEQGEIIRLLLSVLRELARVRNWTDMYIGADQFFAWLEDEPLVRVSPDIYLIDNPPPGPLPSSWQTWRADHSPPRFAVEIVSDDWRKDYEVAPSKYWQLGTRELVIFDPEVAAGRVTTAGRFALQLFCRREDNALVQTYRGKGPIRSDELDAWLYALRQENSARLRVALDSSCTQVLPTPDEARLQAEQRIRDLEAQLAALKSQP